MLRKGLFIILLILFLFAAINVSAQSCTTSDERIFKISAATNAHGEEWDLTNYTEEICVPAALLPTYVAGATPHDCTGTNAVLRLYGTSPITNAHGEQKENSTVGYSDICLGNLQCITRSTSCNVDEECVVKMSDTTNAHFETCTETNYSYLVCCTTPSGNIPPTITIVEPDGVGDTVDPAVTTTYDIQWNDSDPDDDALIALYYDSDSSGLDGTLIVSGLSEDSLTDSYSWGITTLADGDYWVYGIIDDGVNPAVSDYSDGPLTIASAPPPPNPPSISSISANNAAVGEQTIINVQINNPAGSETVSIVVNKIEDDGSTTEVCNISLNQASSIDIYTPDCATSGTATWDSSDVGNYNAEVDLQKPSCEYVCSDDVFFLVYESHTISASELPLVAVVAIGFVVLVVLFIEGQKNNIKNRRG